MAEVKNFGLAGIGSDVQYGKNGGHFKWDGSSFTILGADDSTPVNLKGAVGVAEDDFVTVAQLQSASNGIKVKPAVTTATSSVITGVTTGDNPACTWTGATSFAAATPTAEEVGQFLWAPRTIGGVAVDLNDRVLVRYEGITDIDTNPVVGSGAEKNGLYRVSAITGTVSVTLPTIGNAGTGYAVNDVLTLTGGTFTTAATIQVDSVGGGGEILTVSLLDGGVYSVLPSSPAATTNSGSGDDAATIGFTSSASSDDTVTLVRTVDSGGDLTAAADAAAAYLRNNNTVVYGDYTFVTDGDFGGNAYLLSNYLNVTEPDTGFEPDLNDDAANGYVIFLTFTQAPVYLADDGVELSGQTFRMDIDSLTFGTTNTTDSVISFSDGTGAPNFKSTLHDVFIDNNVPHDLPTFTTAGVITRTAEDTYNTTPIAASTVAGDQGISIVAGYASSIDIGLDITGLSTSAITTAAEVVVYDGTNNVKRTMANVFADLDVVTTPSITNGMLVKTGNDAYIGRSIAVVADGSPTGGLAITNGSGVAGNPTLGLNISGTTAATAALGDQLIAYSAADTVNRKITVQGIIDLVAGTISDNEISQLNSSVVVTDTGTDGTITITADGTTVVTVTDTGLNATALSAQNLTATHVLYAGASGAILGDAGMTYNDSTNALTVAGDTSVGSLTTTVGAVTSQTNVSAGGNITTATGNITATAGTVSGATVTGTTLLSTGAAGSLTVGTGGATVNDLTVAGGIVYTTAGNKLTQEAAFYYDPATTTLYVDNIVSTSGGVGTIAENEIAFGDANGNVIGNAAFVVDATNKTITVGNLTVDGDTGTQGLFGNETDGNINIVPDGAGEVVIGAAGDGTIASDTGSSLTVDGDTELLLTSTAGTVTIQNGTTDVAEFVANASADTGLVFSSDTAANAPSIASSGTSDIKFILGTNNLLIVNDAAAYQTELEAGTNADALTTKGYVDAAIQSGAAAESIKSIMATVPLNADATVNIGDVLPTGAIVLRTKLNVTTLNAGTTVSVGVTGGLDSYMATTENDPQTPGLYLAESFVTNSAQQVVATVANSGNTGSGTAMVIVEYRVPA
jgi:hypothetical protein